MKLCILQVPYSLTDEQIIWAVFWCRSILQKFERGTSTYIKSMMSDLDIIFWPIHWVKLKKVCFWTTRGLSWACANHDWFKGKWWLLFSMLKVLQSALYETYKRQSQINSIPRNTSPRSRLRTWFINQEIDVRSTLIILPVVAWNIKPSLKARPSF